MKNTFFQVIKTGVYTLSACSILALTSCQDSSNEPQATQAHANQFVSTPIQAEVALDESARALVYTLTEGGGFQHNLRESKQRMWTIIRSSDVSKPSYSAELEWEVQAGNKLVLNTQVSLPTNVHTAIQQGDWYASCILSGQASASGQSFVYNASNRRLVATTPNGTNRLDHSGAISAGTETNQMPSLYILPWTKVSTTTNKAGNKVLAFSGSRLQPMGSVLRLNIQTEPATYQILSSSQPEEEIKNNSYFTNATWYPEKISVRGRHNGYYDFATTGLNANVLPPFIYTESSREYSCTLPSTSPQIKFNSTSQEYGLLYFWSPDSQVTISGKLSYNVLKYSQQQDVRETAPHFTPKMYNGQPVALLDFNNKAQYYAVTPNTIPPTLEDFMPRSDSDYLYGTSSDAYSDLRINNLAGQRYYPRTQKEADYYWALFEARGVLEYTVKDSYMGTIGLRNGHQKTTLLKYRPEVSVKHAPIKWINLHGA